MPAISIKHIGFLATLNAEFLDKQNEIQPKPFKLKQLEIF